MNDIDVIVIRPVTAADRAFLESLDDRLIAEAVVPGITPENLVAFQSHYTSVALSGGTPDGATLLALDGAERPLGYIHLEPHEDVLAGTTSGYVSILAVTAEAEGRGVATRLMEAAEAWALDRGVSLPAARRLCQQPVRPAILCAPRLHG